MWSVGSASVCGERRRGGGVVGDGPLSVAGLAGDGADLGVGVVGGGSGALELMPDAGSALGSGLGAPMAAAGAREAR